MPGLRFIPPLSPTLVDEPPEGLGWIHEIKHDGYRTQIIVQDGEARAYTRNGYDWTDRYKPVVADAEKLDCSSAIMDGELIVQDEQGRSDFHSLRAAIQSRPERLVLMAFDLLHLDGMDLRKEPLEARRDRLRALLAETDPTRPIHLSEDVADGAALFAAADAMGLEGVVSKKRTSRYRSGTSKAWLKAKCFYDEELTLIGTERGDKAPMALLARQTDNGLEFAGGAMVTLRQPDRDRFWQTAEALKTKLPPVPMKPRKEASWTTPVMRVRVRTLRGEQMLRHATVRSLLLEAVETPRTNLPA